MNKLCLIELMKYISSKKLNLKTLIKIISDRFFSSGANKTPRAYKKETHIIPLSTSARPKHELRNNFAILKQFSKTCVACESVCF